MNKVRASYYSLLTLVNYDVKINVKIIKKPFLFFSFFTISISFYHNLQVASIHHLVKHEFLLQDALKNMDISF